MLIAEEYCPRRKYYGKGNIFHEPESMVENLIDFFGNVYAE